MMSRALLVVRGAERWTCPPPLPPLLALPLRPLEEGDTLVEGVAALGRDEAASAYISISKGECRGERGVCSDNLY